MLAQNIVYNAQVLQVLLHGLRKDQKIVQIHEHKFVQMLPENVIHQALECGRCVAEAKREHSKLKMPTQENRHKSPEILQKY